MRMSCFVKDLYFIEADVQESVTGGPLVRGRWMNCDDRLSWSGKNLLINGLQYASDGEVVLQLDRDLLVSECFEHGKDQLQ